MSALVLVLPSAFLKLIAADRLFVHWRLFLSASRPFSPLSFRAKIPPPSSASAEAVIAVSSPGKLPSATDADMSVAVTLLKSLVHSFFLTSFLFFMFSFLS